MKNHFALLFRARDKPRDSISSAPSFYFGTSGAGKSVTVSSAIQMSTVYACVRVIAETVASLPIHVYEITEKGNTNPSFGFSTMRVEDKANEGLCRTAKILCHKQPNNVQSFSNMLNFLLVNCQSKCSSVKEK